LAFIGMKKDGLHSRFGPFGEFKNALALAENK